MNILCAGLMVCDILVSPIPQNVLEVDSSRISTLKMAEGGDALNVSVGLSKLGVSTSLCGRVGTDAFGDFLLQQLSKALVGTTTVVRDSVFSTSTSIVLIGANSERHFIYYGDCNDALGIQDVKHAMTATFNHLHIGGALALKALDKQLPNLLSHAKNMGMTVSMDVTWDNDNQWLEKIGDALYHCDYFLPSLDEARQLAGTDSVERMRLFFAKYGLKRLVIKMGKQGSFVTDFTEDYVIPIFEKGTVVDTTGAGDAYVAGFLAGCHYGLDVYHSGILATNTAADCVMAYGATTGIKDLKQTLTFLESVGIKMPISL